MKAGALFAGIGGFCVGFHRADIKTAWAIDNDFFVNETYRLNIRDVRLITENIQRQGVCRTAIEQSSMFANSKTIV
jgi:DNA (cytosine-5)-methyltransferase 1